MDLPLRSCATWQLGTVRLEDLRELAEDGGSAGAAVHAQGHNVAILKAEVGADYGASLEGLRILAGGLSVLSKYPRL